MFVSPSKRLLSFLILLKILRCPQLMIIIEHGSTTLIMYAAMFPLKKILHAIYKYMYHTWVLLKSYCNTARANNYTSQQTCHVLEQNKTQRKQKFIIEFPSTVKILGPGHSSQY